MHWNMRALTACFALCVLACSPAPEAPRAPAAEAPAAALAADPPVAAPVTVGNITISNGWIAQTPNGVTVSAGYMSLANSARSADALIAVSSPRARQVAMHELRFDGVMMVMHPVARMDVAAGQSLALEPNGWHLMFDGVDQPLTPGEQIPVVLTFEHAGAVNVTLPVRSGAESQQ